MELRPLEEFDIHEINRLIQRERIPGFKMLPKEQKYLEEYRETLRHLYGGKQGKIHENKKQIVPIETSDEVVVEIKTSKKATATKTATEEINTEVNTETTEEPQETPTTTKRTRRKKTTEEPVSE